MICFDDISDGVNIVWYFGGKFGIDLYGIDVVFYVNKVWLLDLIIVKCMLNIIFVDCKIFRNEVD